MPAAKKNPKEIADSAKFILVLIYSFVINDSFGNHVANRNIHPISIIMLNVFILFIFFYFYSSTVNIPISGTDTSLPIRSSIKYFCPLSS